MSDHKLLDFTLLAFTSSQLEIKVKNISGSALDQTLLIEIKPPMYLVDKRIKEAAKEAATNEEMKNMASLAGVVTVAEGWSVWAIREMTDSVALIQLYNDVDQKTGDIMATPVKLSADAEFTLRIPLNPQASRARVELPYSYNYGEQQDNRVDGKLELKPADAGEWTPDVTLSIDHKSPTMIEPGSLVKIFWHIKDGVSATLRGPLPGGNSELTLSTDPTSNFKIADGSLEIRAVSSMTYLLQAEVKRPGDQPNVQVVRMLSLDTATSRKYSYMNVRPARVLPNGLMEIDWAAWGVEGVQISVSGHSTRYIKLTQQNLSRFYQGTGVMRVSARKPDIETVTLQGQFKQSQEKPRTATISVISWEHMVKPDFTGHPLGLAVIAPKIALLTSDGLWTASVGDNDDKPLKKLMFSKVTQNTPGEWLALAALDKRFVVLRRTNQDDLQVASYNSDGQPDEVPPVDLPGDLRALAGRGNTVYDLAAFGERVYVVVETFVSGRTLRRAFSVGFDNKTKKAELRPEPLLEPLAGYRLITFDNALYALNRNFGHMFRFSLTAGGKLEQPCKAASAVKSSENAFKKEQSMIRQGLLVPVGRVLAVLNPSSVPSLASLAAFGLHNVLSYVNLQPPADPNTIPQDLVYNPQQNYWARCGHDLEVKKGAVAAFRGGDSPRLWVIQPGGETHTLAVGSEHLFACDYVKAFPPKVLPPFLNKKRQFTLKNNSGLHFIPMSETYRKAGLQDFSSTGPAEITSLPNQFPRGLTATVEFKYNEADPMPITLRFLAKRDPSLGARADTDYMLEVTFSGPDLSSATSVFKRLVTEGQGKLSVDEIFGSQVEHSTNSTIEVPRPGRFDEIVNLIIVNASQFNLKQNGLNFEPPYILDSSEVKLKYNYPDFSLMSDGRGEPRTSDLRVNLDFAKPPGIEVSSGSQRQSSLIRLNPDKAHALHVRLVTILTPGDPPLQLDGSKTPISATNNPLYVCQIGYLLKEEVPAISIGDGVASDNPRDQLYIPVANPQNVSQVQVCKINTDNLTIAQSAIFSGGGIFSLPNSISLSRDRVFALFGDNHLQIMDYALQVKEKKSLGNYNAITSLKSSDDGEIYLLAMREGPVGQQNIKHHYMLVIADARAGVNTREISLDAVRGIREQNPVAGTPAWVSPSTLSPMAIEPTRNAMTGRKIAICIEGGLVVIQTKTEKIDLVNLEPANRQEAVVFDPRGEWIYCAHSQSDNKGLKISRVRVNNLQEKPLTLVLPSDEAVSDLTSDTRGAGTPGALYKRPRAASLIMSLDPKFLFVSQGKSILQIDTNSMTVRRTLAVELPCRLIHVTQGPNRCWLVYAIGSTYNGNGSNAGEFKTQLYKLAIVSD